MGDTRTVLWMAWPGNISVTTSWADSLYGLFGFYILFTCCLQGGLAVMYVLLLLLSRLRPVYLENSLEADINGQQTVQISLKLGLLKLLIHKGRGGGRGKE